MSDQLDQQNDPVFEEEQAHLSSLYQKLLQMRDAISADLESSHAGAAQDLITMSEEVRLDFGGADETMETLAAIETLNSVIDAYNQYHDFNVDKLRRVMLLLMQPYFAKVKLQMRPGRPARDVYIGAAGMTDERSIPLVVDWRSPVAETYYNQEMGPTSYSVDGKVRTVILDLRRQFEAHDTVEKTYLAVCHWRRGCAAQGTLTRPIDRQRAVSRYTLLGRQGALALVRFDIETGRTHQIRIHAAKELGCPIVGDPLYGDAARDRQLHRRPSRTLLHAVELAFRHPMTGALVRFSAPPPDDLVYAG